MSVPIGSYSPNDVAVLVNGTRTDVDIPLADSDTVDILPPFAGG